MNVRVTVPGRGYSTHSESAKATTVDLDGSTGEIFPRPVALQEAPGR